MRQPAYSLPLPTTRPLRGDEGMTPEDDATWNALVAENFPDAPAMAFNSGFLAGLSALSDGEEAALGNASARLAAELRKAIGRGPGSR